MDKTKMKDRFEFLQIEFLINLELETGLSLKKGDKIVFIQDKDKREAILRKLLRENVSISFDEDKEKTFFEESLKVNKGEFQAISSNLIYTGVEIVVNQIILPLLAVESINGKVIDWDNIIQQQNYGKL